MKQTLTKLVLAALLIFMFGGSVYLIQKNFTTSVTGANDFFPRWKGAELFFEAGVNPYSAQATTAIQTDMYGRPARPDEDQVAFAYPFYTVYILAPLVGLDLPYSWVQAIWMTLLFTGLTMATFFNLRLLSWEIPLWLLALAILWSVLFYNSVRTIILGQFAGLVFLFIVGCLFALRQGHHWIAGALLALTTIKPQMGILLILALLLWALSRRHLDFLLGFGMTMALLVGGSFIAVPSWLTDFIDQVIRYTNYTAIGSPIWIVANRYIPSLSTVVEIGASLVLLLYLISQWRHLPSISAADGHFLRLISITLLVTNLIVPRTATTNQVVLFIPILWVLKQLSGSGVRNDVFTALFFVLSLAGVWFVFLQTHGGQGERPIMYLILPVGTAIMMIGERLARPHQLDVGGNPPGAISGKAH